MVMAQPAVMCFDKNKKKNWDGDRELLSHFRWTRDDLTEIRTSLCKRTVHLIVPYGLLSECDKSNAECWMLGGCLGSQQVLLLLELLTLHFHKSDIHFWKTSWRNARWQRNAERQLCAVKLSPSRHDSC